MDDQHKTVEQLWYTWSDVGLDTIRAGFRIRAASAGLTNYKSECVKNLDRYLRYSLPEGVNPAIIPLNVAPICLSLITSGQERILVHKAYTGKDGVGRYGAFFVHLLAGLPEKFSARDAISLWKSPFWQNSDRTLKNPRSTSLDCVSLEQLRKMRKGIPLDRQAAAKVREYLPYVIQAYLTKKPLTEKKQTVPQKLYIAADDDDIALFILGLTRCLPEQLLKGLTFSTYERDVAQATTEIIGTCWLSVPGAEKDSRVKQLLPTQYYEEKLALNCYTGKWSQLEENRLVENKPLAAQFARDATEYFVRGDSRKFEKLLNTARDNPILDVDKFLDLYDRLIIRERSTLNAEATKEPKQGIRGWFKKLWV